MSTIPKTSRAACVVAFQKPLEIRELPIPETLEPGAILVKIEAASICGSDVHLWQGELGAGDRLRLPIILGHEMMGRVARLGPEDMLSSRYRLDQINDAMEAMRAFREVKPVVVP